MRIGLVTRHLGLPVGFGTYAVNLLRALDSEDDDNEYFLYAPAWSDLPSLGPRFHTRLSRVSRQSRVALTLWDLMLPSAAAARDSLDLVHYLHPGFPAVPRHTPVIVNLFDAIHWLVPGYRLPAPYDWLERRAAHRADLVLTLSESARADLREVLDLSRTRIRVTYLGAPPIDPISAPNEPAPPKPYFLFVGGTERRKNLSCVLEAFSSLEGFELRVVGSYAQSPIHDGRTDQRGVRWLGHVSEDGLIGLYRQATALVFPSRYEGFGLPALEAMARRTPVIAANRGSLAEVTRGAAILVDPSDVAGLRDAMRRVATEPQLRVDMATRGVEVASSFSWSDTARATLAAYEELCT